MVPFTEVKLLSGLEFFMDNKTSSFQNIAKYNQGWKRACLSV
jgi:hypothetical protein